MSGSARRRPCREEVGARSVRSKRLRNAAPLRAPLGGITAPPRSRRSALRSADGAAQEPAQRAEIGRWRRQEGGADRHSAAAAAATFRGDDAAVATNGDMRPTSQRRRQSAASSRPRAMLFTTWLTQRDSESLWTQTDGHLNRVRRSRADDDAERADSCNQMARDRSKGRCSYPAGR